MSDDRFLTAAEAAARLGISLRTARRRIADGTLSSVRIGGAVRVPESALQLPVSGMGAAAREVIAPYGTESGAEYVTRWNADHWPDTYERLLARRSRAFEELARLSALTKPPSGPHDTVDGLLNRVRDEFGERLLPFIQPPPAELE